MSRKLCLLTILTLLCLQGAISAQNSQPIFSGDALVFSKAENFWTEAEVTLMERQGQGGRSPERAFVTLLFDDSGHLLTPQEYNADYAVAETTSSHFFTDLQTYRAVIEEFIASGSQAPIRLGTATADYVSGIGLSDADAVYLYDPYQKFYEINEETQKAMEKMSEEEYVPPKQRR